MMNERSASAWENRRKQGRKSYVLRYWTLGLALTATFLLTLIEWLSQSTFDWRWVVIRLVVFAVIGFLIGNTLWDSKENKYAAYRTTESPSHSQSRPKGSA